MKTQPRRAILFRDQSGQAAALIALLLFFAFLPLASLAIDGAVVYLVRRDLQNVADASALSACRVLAANGAESASITAALNTIQINLGSSAEFVGTNPPTTNSGSGVNLLKGIEVSIPQVRVALQRRAPTVLTQFFGRDQTIVTAQARCDSTAGGGLMPIAIQRYDGATGGTLRDYIANKGASGYPPAAPPVPYPSDSSPTTFAGRYGPFQVPVPLSQYTCSDGALAAGNTGPEVLLLGQSAETNNVASSMRDLVLLDIRNVASLNALEYYNGADSQADAAKYMSQGWIYQHGYPGPYPQIGSQVAILDGASNAFAAGAMQTAGYRPGDVIAAVVYDGYVWTAPDYSVALVPTNASNGVTLGYPTSDASAVAYNVNIAKAGAASEHWFSPLDFTFKFDFTNDPVPPDTHVTLNGTELTAPDYSYSLSNVTEAGWTGSLRIWSTFAITQAQYLSGLDMIAESSVGLTHGASSNFGFGTISADYAARSNSGKLVVRQGGGATANLVTLGAGTLLPSQCRNVPVQADILAAGTPLSWATYLSSGQTDEVTVKKNADQSTSVALNARSDAFAGDYTLRLTVGSAGYTCSGNNLPIHTVEIPLQILPPAPNATPNKFVFIQGYANFRISRVDANDVWGYAISQLYSSYEDITIGLRPRLVPWS
jgi:Flp pilus assembly protein TadG